MNMDQSFTLKELLGNYWVLGTIAFLVWFIGGRIFAKIVLKQAATKAIARGKNPAWVAYYKERNVPYNWEYHVEQYVDKDMIHVSRYLFPISLVVWSLSQVFRLTFGADARSTSQMYKEVIEREAAKLKEGEVR